MDQQSLPPVRFRAIIEMSFPDADRLDPDYDRLIDAWRKALEENPAFNCKDVSIREIMTIGSSESEDDYERWRCEDLSHLSPGIRVTGSQSVSASCNLEPPDLPRLLRAIEPLIEKGFSDTEIDAVQRLSVSTPVKRTGTKTFPISFRGKDTTLRVELNKDDVDEIEIWFYTGPELAKAIRSKMMEIGF